MIDELTKTQHMIDIRVNVNAVVMKQVVIDMTNYLYMIVEDCLLWRIVVLIEEALQLILVFQMNAEEVEVALTQELMKHGWRSIVEWSGWREQSTLPPMFLLVIATNRIGSEAVHQQLGKGINTPGMKTGEMSMVLQLAVEVENGERNLMSG